MHNNTYKDFHSQVFYIFVVLCDTPIELQRCTWMASALAIVGLQEQAVFSYMVSKLYKWEQHVSMC